MEIKKITTFGELLLRLSPPGFLRFSQTNSLDLSFGGSELNVAISLANYGVPTDFVTRLPVNDVAASAIMELKKRGVGTGQIVRGGDRTGLYFLETGAVSRSSKVVYDRAHSSMATITRGMIDWEAVLSDTKWFHWSGITPAISQQAADVCMEAIQTAYRLGITISTDLNHREMLWNYGKSPDEIMPGLLKYTHIILANEHDAAIHLNIHPTVSAKDGYEGKRETFESLSSLLIKSYGNLQKVVYTYRNSINASTHTWAGFLTDGVKTYESNEYRITHIVDRVGAGDSFMAGLIYGLVTDPDNNQRALDFAVAASCLKHTIHGDANLASVEEIEKLMNGDQEGRILR